MNEENQATLAPVEAAASSSNELEEVFIPNSTNSSDDNELDDVIPCEPVVFEGKGIKVTITIGFSAKKEGQSVDEWIQDADNKLYYGKNNGKNHTEFTD